MMITSYYCFLVMQSQKINQRFVGGDPENATALFDFDMLLMSVIPHKQFIRFLQEDMSQCLPYLQMIHLCKLYLDDL
jgi:hypothetical protein